MMFAHNHAENRWEQKKKDFLTKKDMSEGNDKKVKEEPSRAPGC